MPEYDAFDPGYVEEVVDFGGQFKDENEVNAPEYVMEGIYHVVVSKVDPTGKNFPGAVFFTFEILAGNVPGQEGKEIRWPFWPVPADAKNVEAAKKRWQKNALRLMLALGLRQPGEFPKVTFNEEWWTGLEGRQCVAKVTHSIKKVTSDSGKKSEWVSADIKSRDDLFPIGDEAVSGVPLNEEAAVLGGYIGEKGQDI